MIYITQFSGADNNRQVLTPLNVKEYMYNIANNIWKDKLDSPEVGFRWK